MLSVGSKLTAHWRDLTTTLARSAFKHGMGSMACWLPMSELKKAAAPILVEKGEDPSVLVIAFTGGAHHINMPLFEFLETTQILGYSRILLKDKYRMFYHYGVDRKRRDWPTLLAYLRSEIARLGAKTIFSIGSSSGGYAALIAGHYLKADYVHAFGPQTKIAIDPEGIRNALLPKRRLKLSVSARTLREVLDLVPVLQNSNGKTHYFVHYCSAHQADREFAERVIGLPSVTTLGYPCDIHQVAICLAKQRFLAQILRVSVQNKLPEIARAHFGEKIAITGPQNIKVERAYEDISPLNPLTT